MKILKHDLDEEGKREIEIMKYVENPFINKILNSYVNNEGNVVIIQELAVIDLKKFITDNIEDKILCKVDLEK